MPPHNPIALARALADIQAILRRLMSDAQQPPTVVVLTALSLEFAAVRAHLVDVETHTHPAGTVFEVGRPSSGANIRVALAVIGTGTAGAAALAEQAIAEFSPAAVLLVGTAGALQGHVKLADIVVATKIYGFHGGKEEANRFFVRPEAWPASFRLEQLARRVEWDGTWMGQLQRRPLVHFRPIASGDVVLNSRTTPLARQLNRQYNDAIAIENESAGAAKACHLRALPMLAVRAISDKADGRKYATDKAGWPHVAAAHAAAFAAALITAIAGDSDDPSW